MSAAGRLNRVEVERDAVHAPALIAGILRPVIEDMPEVREAADATAASSTRPVAARRLAKRWVVSTPAAGASSAT
jgi:hypothetical protein